VAATVDNVLSSVGNILYKCKISALKSKFGFKINMAHLGANKPPPDSSLPQDAFQYIVILIYSYVL